MKFLRQIERRDVTKVLLKMTEIWNKKRYIVLNKKTFEILKRKIGIKTL